MTAASKYTGATGDEYEPGSNGLVLRNKLGITDPQEMAERELDAYALADSDFGNSFGETHSFSEADVCAIHNAIFGELYEWAGRYRSVDLSREGFMFARAVYLAELMKNFAADILAPATPGACSDIGAFARQLATIHAEFILIHPFRDGNGRTGRLLLSLIAQQAGFTGLNFRRFLEGEKYIRGIHEAMGSNYAPLAALMETALLAGEHELGD